MAKELKDVWFMEIMLKVSTRVLLASYETWRNIILSEKVLTRSKGCLNYGDNTDGW